MTAVFNPDVLGQADTDAELTRAAVSGDKRAFAMIYDRYSNRLYDFCVGMIGNRDGAADCVQDVFCTAATQLPRLRDPDKLRPWLYSIARNEALRRIRDQQRETPTDDLPEAACGDAGPEALAARLELADLIADAAGGLSDRDRSVLELAFRHGLSGPDLAAVLGVTPANANTIVHRLRQNIERSLGALLVSRRVRADGGCAELRAILDGWDGTFNVLMRKRISRHIESCATCDEQRRRLASPAALLGAAPVLIPAPAWLRDQTLREVQLASSTATIHPIPARADEGRSSVLPVAVFVIALIAALGVVVLWATSPTATTVPVPIEASQTMAPPAPVNPGPVTPMLTAAPLTPERPAAIAPPAVSVPTTAPVAPSPSPSSVAPPPPSTQAAPPPSWPPFPHLPPWPQFPQWPDGPSPVPADPGDPGGEFTGPSDLGSLPPADPSPVG